MDILRLFALRHGETGWTAERRFTGARDVELTPHGQLQAGALARALAAEPVVAVYASPLARARATATAVAAPHGLEVALEPDFREMAFGDWEGLTREEAARHDPELFGRWRTVPDLVTPPGGEALRAVAERVLGALAGLRKRHAAGTVVLVTHAIVLRLIVLDALGLGPDRLWALDASPAGLTEIEYQPSWITVHRMNTLAHLRGLQP